MAGLFDYFFFGNGMSQEDIEKSASNRGRRQWNPGQARAMFDWEVIDPETGYVTSEDALKAKGAGGGKLKVARSAEEKTEKVADAEVKGKDVNYGFWKKVFNK